MLDYYQLFPLTEVKGVFLLSALLICVFTNP